MPTLQRTHNLAASDVRTWECLQNDLYLTDEVFLYRVVAVMSRGTDQIVALEDCYGLDVVEIFGAELGKRSLRVVMPSTGR